MKINFKKRQFRFWLCFSAALSGIIWIAVAKLIIRPLLQAAYSDQGLPVVGNIILGLNRPLDRLLWRLDTLTEAGLIFFLAFGFIALVTTSKTFFTKFVGKATPETLGSIRIITCGFLLASALWEEIASSALLPSQMRVFMGTMEIFYALPIGFDAFTDSYAALQIFKWLTVLILFLATIGWQTKWVLPLGGILYCIFGGIIRQYEHFGHAGIVPLYLIFVLAFTPCGDGLSVDRFWKIRQGKTVPKADEYDPIYGWSRYACWVVLAMVYLAAALSKLTKGGFFWWNATNMRTIVFTDALNPARVDWGLGLNLISAPKLLFILLGIAGLFGELFYASVLFSKLARRIFPPLMAMMHTGIFLLQNIAFFDLIILQLIYYDFTKIRQAISRKLKRDRLLITRESLPKRAFLPNLYYPLLVTTLSVFLLLTWVYRVEFYPITAWQMYSGSNTTGEIEYYKVLAHRQSGETTKAYLEQAIGAMKNGRYKRVTRKFCFDPAKVNVCKKYLDISATTYNRSLPSEDHIVAYEIQKWQWNFLKAPSGPDSGKLKERFFYKTRSYTN